MKTTHLRDALVSREIVANNAWQITLHSILGSSAAAKNGSQKGNVVNLLMPLTQT